MKYEPGHNNHIQIHVELPLIPPDRAPMCFIDLSLQQNTPTRMHTRPRDIPISHKIPKRLSYLLRPHNPAQQTRLLKLLPRLLSIRTPETSPKLRLRRTRMNNVNLYWRKIQREGSR
jgi:hypothetical protein